MTFVLFYRHNFASSKGNIHARVCGVRHVGVIVSACICDVTVERSVLLALLSYLTWTVFFFCGKMPFFRIMLLSNSIRFEHLLGFPLGFRWKCEKVLWRSTLEIIWTVWCVRGIPLSRKGCRRSVESAFHRSWGKWRQGDSTQTDSLIFDSREYLITVKVRWTRVGFCFIWISWFQRI